jgi:hypothetical protein
MRPKHLHGRWLDTVEADHDKSSTYAPQQLPLREHWILHRRLDMWWTLILITQCMVNSSSLPRVVMIGLQAIVRSFRASIVVSG